MHNIGMSTHKMTENTQKMHLTVLSKNGSATWRWTRIQMKALLLRGRLRSGEHSGSPLVGFSECDEPQDSSARFSRIESALSRLEEKIDMLVHAQLCEKKMPPWFEASQKSAIEEFAGMRSDMRGVLLQNRDLIEENHHVRGELAEMAEGADKFIANLQQKLTKKELELFFGGIATKEDNGTRRVLTYAEIGRQFGITKQAVQKRLRSLESRNPAVAEYIAAIRRPPKPRSFSAMSPSQRRKHGIDEAYNYDQQ